MIATRTPSSPLDHAWRSPNVIERFATQLGDHLADGGHALVVLSSDGEESTFVAALADNGFNCRIVAERDFLNEQMRVYQVKGSFVVPPQDDIGPEGGNVPTLSKGACHPEPAKDPPLRATHPC